MRDRVVRTRGMGEDGIILKYRSDIFMITTLVHLSNLHYFAKYICVLIDECHHGENATAV